MKTLISKITLVAAVGGLALSIQAQAPPGYIVVAHDDFDQNPVGAGTVAGNYGRIAYNFSGAGVGNPQVGISNTFPDTLTTDPTFTHTNYVAFTFDSTNTSPPLPLNFGWDINSLGASLNTDTVQGHYAIQYDIQVRGDGINNLGGFVGPIHYIFGQPGPGMNWGSGEYYGNGAQTNINAGFFPAAGTGWTHVFLSLDGWGTANAAPLVTTSAAFSVGFGAYMAGLTDTNTQEIDIANLEVLLNTNPPPPPPPTNSIVKTKPGLRIFAQNNQATYNQEGFSTQDTSQSWVGVATQANPVSYSVKIGDFNTANGFALYLQFAQNATPGNPFGVYNAANALVWTIQSGGGTAGFTTSVNWKTNLPSNGENNVAAPNTATTSTNGIGIWTLTFTNDLDGLITAPDGTTVSVALPDEAAAADFASPLIVDFGIAPNNTAGYGQWITINNIAISNVVDGNEIDDFTTDTNLNTTLWNPGFSLDAGSVIQVPPGVNYWINWTFPAEGFGLETKASLKEGTNMWFSPAYYGSGIGASNTPPKRMGFNLFWTLVPNTCFPTTDGTTNGPVAPSGFFRLANPPPSQ